ncbi:hypothetical protein HDU97_000075 [Phlyctochytrium planicorne]|nr:hypothetical protein HDU97_000075 [Phlyctochytrium planicorne]
MRPAIVPVCANLMPSFPIVSIGDPYEPFTIGSLKVPRYRVALFGILGYATLYFGYSTYSKFQPKKPITFSSKEEEDYVKRYIKHAHAEAHKPELVKQPYLGPSGLN